MPDLPPDYRGPNVFHYLAQPEDDWLSSQVRDEIATAISQRLSSE